MSFHKDLETGDIHKIYDQVYADDTARDADTTWNGDSSNIGKCVLVTADNTVFMLLSVTPSWFEFGGSAVTVDTIYSADGTIDTVRTVSITGDNTLAFRGYNLLASTFTAGAQVSVDGGEAIAQAFTGPGDGSISHLSRLLINTSTMQVLDQINSKGLVYGADYSANFTNRSIVDKAWVEAHTGGGSIYTADGTITGPRTLTANNGNYLQFFSYDTTVADFTNLSALSVDDTAGIGALYYAGDGAGGSTGSIAFVVRDTGVSLTDNITATSDVFVLSCTSLTTGNLLNVASDSLTTGRLAHFYSNSSDAGVRSLVNIHNDNASASNVIALDVTQDSNSRGIRLVAGGITTGLALDVHANGLTSGSAASFYSNSANIGTRSLVQIVNDNPAATGTTALYVRQDSTGLAANFAGTVQASSIGIGTGTPAKANFHVLNSNIRLQNVNVPYAAGVFGNNIIYIADNQYLDNSTALMRATSTGSSNILQMQYNTGFQFASAPSYAEDTAVSNTEIMRLHTLGGLAIGSGIVTTDPGVGSLAVENTITFDGHTAARRSASTTEVFSADDLPSPVAGVITLPTGHYVFRASIVLSDRIVLDTGATVNIYFEAAPVDSLVYTGTGVFISGAPARLSMFDSYVVCSNSASTVFGITAGYVTVEKTRIETAGAMGSISGATSVVLRSSTIAGFTGGLQFVNPGVFSVNAVANVPSASCAEASIQIGGTSTFGGVIDTMSAYLTNASGSVFKIDSAFASPVSVMNVSFVGLGTFFDSSGLDETSPYVFANQNGSQKDSMNIAFGNVNGNTTATTILSADAYHFFDVGTMTENPVTETWHLSDADEAEFTYDGIIPTVATIRASMWCYKAGNTESYRFALSINGATPTWATADYVPADVKTDKEMTTLMLPVSLSPGDTIQVVVGADNHTDNLVISDMTIDIIGK